MIDHRRQAGTDLGLVAVADRLDEQLAQGAALELELAEHVEHLAAERLARLLQLFEELAIDIALAGLLGHQIPEVAHFGLADAVNAAEALLEAVRVPRQIVVDHQVRALEVDAFAGGIGGQQHLHFGSCLKDSCAFIRSSRPMPPWIMTTASLRPSRVVMRLEVVQRVAVLGEEERASGAAMAWAVGSGRARRRCSAPAPRSRRRGR